RIELVEAYCHENMLWHDPDHQPTYSQVVDLDLDDVEPSLAGPRRPQDRLPLTEAKASFLGALPTFGVGYGNNTEDNAVEDTYPATDAMALEPPGSHAGDPEPTAAPVAVAEPESAAVSVELDGESFELQHGSVVIAAITSCTNTSNPQVMVGAGLLAKKAVELGLRRRPWVKSSLAPGSRVVTDYYERAGLQQYLDELGFNKVGYGVTKWIDEAGT